jgi:hypothetical protein
LAFDKNFNVLRSQWDAEASERRELAAKKAALASAEIAKFSKCVSGTSFHGVTFCAQLWISYPGVPSAWALVGTCHALN